MKVHLWRQEFKDHEGLLMETWIQWGPGCTYKGTDRTVGVYIRRHGSSGGEGALIKVRI